MSDLYLIGNSALNAYRSALATIGENVANSQTDGYSRRQVNLREIPPSRSSDLIFADTVTFAGVRAQSVTRAWDEYVAIDARASLASANRASVRERWLTAGESALDDGPAGVGSLLSGFFDAGTSLAGTPDDALGRRSMLMALNDAAGSIRDTAGALKRVSDGIGQSAKLEIDGLNNDLAALAKTNRQLIQTPPGTPVYAALEDERDRTLGQIAGRTEVDVSIDRQGVATVTLSGSPDKVLVDRAGANSVTVALADDGRMSFGLLDDGTLTPLPAIGGTLGGLAESAAITADRRAELDTIAVNFATTINAWSAAGRKADGTAGQPLVSIAAGAASLAVLASDPADIAAAGVDGTANGNLLALSGLRGAGSSEERWGNLVAGHAVMLASAKAESSAASVRRDNSFAELDQVTGVDLDREAAELMRYQQAYNAATRLIQIARETTQTILDIL